MLLEIVPNLLTRKDLLAVIGNVSYDSLVTQAEFWRSVGQRLAEIRKQKALTLEEIRANGGPTNKTIQDIDAGKVRNLSKITNYSDRMDVNLIDVFKAVLTTNTDEQDHELQLVMQEFRLGGASVKNALYSNAKMSEEMRLLRSQGSPVAQVGSHQETPRGVTATAKRRARK